MARTDSSQPIDKHLGSRVRMRRIMLNMGQTKLGDALGITFQQVHRYEKGINRIRASRLQHISQILRVPVAFFFEDDIPAPGDSKHMIASSNTIMDFMATSATFPFLRSRPGPS
jgi:transcriptional regulator with XRE-family HTH domain